MNRRTLLTLSTFACLCGACAMYIAVVSPFVSPAAELLSEKRTTSENVTQRRPENQRQAEAHLSDYPWTVEAKYQVAVRAGSFVFADTWEKIEQSGRVRFTPFAMIWRSENHDPNEPPITIVSDSAIVEFAEDFEITKPNDLGRVVGGALEGEVRIRGPKGLAVDGRDFNFSEGALRVWSDNLVAFAYEQNTGNGQGLELDLIPEPGTPGKDKPAIAGVRTVRLRKDVVMDLQGKPHPDGRPADSVHVTSAGRFEFSVESHVASFHDEVRVVHPSGKDQFDRLNCQTLTLIFEPEKSGDEAGEQGKEKAVADSSSSSPLGGDAGGLEFRRLRAEGPNTTVSSQRSEFQARMQELTYDAEARVIVLKDARSVRVLQKDNELVCGEITAVLDEDGQLEQAICRGAGKLFRYAKEGGAPVRKKEKIELAAEWARELQMRPDPETQLDLIELTGKAVVSQTDKMALKADAIRIWITPEAKGKKDSSSAESRNRTPLEEDAKPKRMLAVGDAAFASPKITGETERLEVWFEDGPLPTAPEPRAAKRRDNFQSSLPSVGRPPLPRKPLIPIHTVQYSGNTSGRRNPRDTGGVNSSRGGLAAVPAESPKKTPRPQKSKQRVERVAQAPKAPGKPREDNPAHIVANRIRVRARVDGDETNVAEVITEGRVHVTQNRAEGEAPFDLRGDRLHLLNYSEVHQVIDVTGTPAHVRDRGLHVEGAEIHFDRGANVAEVEGAGVLRLPVKRSFDGKPLETAQTLDIFWRERMNFDGELAHFYAGVRTQLNGSEVRCEEMQVELDQKLSFTEEREDRPDPNVRKVICRDGVDLKSNEYVNDRLVEVRIARGFEFTFDQAKNSINAQGPGTLIFWRRGGGNRPGLARATGAKANKPLQADSSEWEYTRVDFEGHMSGNIERESTTFHSDVRIAYGPVSGPTEVVDVNSEQPPLQGGRMRCQELNLTQYPGENGQGKNITLLGKTNVELEGRTEHGLFHARAAKVSYDQAKDLFILFGDGRRGATISRESKPGVGSGSNAAQRMEFIPSQNKVNVHNATGAQGSV